MNVAGGRQRSSLETDKNRTLVRRLPTWRLIDFSATPKQKERSMKKPWRLSIALYVPTNTIQHEARLKQVSQQVTSHKTPHPPHHIQTEAIPQPSQPKKSQLHEPTTHRWILDQLYRTDIHTFAYVETLTRRLSKNQAFSEGSVLTWSQYNVILPCSKSSHHKNYVQAIPSIFQTVRQYGFMWMVLLFYEHFSIFRKAAMRKANWHSVPTPKYIAKAIVNGL